MKKLLISSLLLTFSFSVFAQEEKKEPVVPENIQTLQSLLEQVKKDGLKEKGIHKQRELEFLKNKNQQQAQLKKAKSELRATQKETDRLKNQFDRNEESLAKLSDELRQRMGNLGEMYGVVRQVSQDVAAVRLASLVSVEIGAESDVLNTLAESKALPGINQLEQLWFEIQNQMTVQSEVKTQNQNYVNAAGQKVSGPVTHVGPFVAFNADGYLQYDSETAGFIELSPQPSEAGLIGDYLSATSEVAPLSIDPTRGVLLGLTTQSPDVVERIQQGGPVGYVILVLAVLGVLFAFWRIYVLLGIGKRVDAQLANLDKASDDNPLGRVLAAYHDQKDLDLETIEMKLDEAVLKEMPHLEKGHSIIKLLAGVAPLLGLLGTVMGMIATFQSITLFGTGDPKLMAGGISQALITTVLGLVAAIPLLFMHNLVSSRSRHLIQVLDQQAAGLVAESAEKAAVKSKAG